MRCCTMCALCTADEWILNNCGPWVTDSSHLEYILELRQRYSLLAQVCRRAVGYCTQYSTIMVITNASLSKRTRYWSWLLDDDELMCRSSGSSQVTVGRGFPSARQNSTALAPSKSSIIVVHMLIRAALCVFPDNMNVRDTRTCF